MLCLLYRIERPPPKGSLFPAGFLTAPLAAARMPRGRRRGRCLPRGRDDGRSETVNDDRRCLVIDPQPTVRLGVREALAHRYEVEEAESGTGALELLTSIGDFDVVIVDLCRSSAAHLDEALIGTAAIRPLHQAQPSLGIVAHGAHPEQHAATEAIRAGATAYVVKSSPVESLSNAVDAAAESERFVDPVAKGLRGRPALTRRQREILQL